MSCSWRENTKMTEQMNELISQISIKQRELLNLQCSYDEQIEQQKAQVLKAKSKGNMEKSLYLHGFDFESSSCRTPQYLEFHRTFKRELTQVLKPYCSRIEISKPNHFDVTGFFQLHSGEIYYFNLGDLRWSKDLMLIRTAKDF